MSDKRSVHTDALATLGTIIDESGKRDAIHLAVEPCVAGMKLYPGQDVGIDDGMAMNLPRIKFLGIVDPFLKNPVQEGEMFWLIVYPRQITSLRHVWEHPDFDNEPTRAEVFDIRVRSEEWLREFCNTHDCPSYETVIGAVLDGRADNEEYFYFSGTDAHDSIPDEFWRHVENVTGRVVSNPPSLFTCSC